MSSTPLDRARTIASRHLSRTVLVAAGLAAASFVAGCGGAPPDSPKDVAATSDDAQAVTAAPVVEAPAATVEVLPKAERVRRHGAFARLQALDLRDEQRVTIDAIHDDLQAKLEPTHTEARELAELLAAGIERGKVDDVAVSKKRAAVEQRMVEAQNAFADAANAVHATLDVDQRTELVLTMRARRDGEPTPKEKANAEATGEHHHRRAGKVATELGISDEQMRSLREGARSIFETAFPDRQAKRERFEADRKAAEDAFMSDTFDAHQYSFGKEALELLDVAAAGAGKLSDLAATVLTKGQRAAVAQKIRAAVEHR